MTTLRFILPGGGESTRIFQLYSEDELRLAAARGKDIAKIKVTDERGHFVHHGDSIAEIIIEFYIYFWAPKKISLEEEK